MLVIDVSAQVLMLLFIKTVLNFCHLVLSDSGNKILVPLELHVPPVLPRLLVGILQNLGDPFLLLLYAQVLEVLPLLFDGLFNSERELESVELSHPVVNDRHRFQVIMVGGPVQP